jgi:hypothetical protein
MKRVVLTFGLIAGAILSVMLLATLPFIERIGFDRGEILGYASMVAAFLLIFFGVRAYRDNVADGRVGFGRAFAVGALIALVASACYVATWQVVYYTIAPDFAEKYQEHVLEKERARGASEADLARRQLQMERFAELYRNPFFNIAVTFIEPLPVGLVIALVSAGVLRRPRGGRDAPAVPATAGG